ncbi:Protein spinster-like protein 1 [Aphelenchoides bicaudatus]|nr:Protein spinster-like protein 1 [Aphelenchoides bicaudatus]
MGAGINPEQFEEVSLSNMAVPPLQTKEKTGSRPNMECTGEIPMSNSVRKWATIAILVFTNLLNYMDRFTIAGVLTEIQNFFTINDTYAGLLQTAFIVSFMIAAPLCGYLGDRYNRKIIMVVGLIIWIAAVLGSTFVPPDHFWAFILLRSIVGIGEASYSIVGPTIIADMFANSIRSKVLMIFYFAIPVGSGLGFIVGSKVSALAHDWRWGVRVTPPLGIACILAIIFVIREPERGQADKQQGAENVGNQPDTNYWQDLLYLLKNKTYVWSTIGYTAVVFVTGTLSWWTTTAIEYSEAHQRNLTSLGEFPLDAKSNISLIFGAIMTVGGLVGVSVGIVFAQSWKKGQMCFKGRHNSRADPIVCAIGSAVACPFLFFGMYMISVNEVVSWISIFIAVTFLCLNWAVNVDMLLYIVLPNKRALATGMQILVSHMLGDASGPYLIGLISESVRRGNTPKAHYDSLLTAFYVPTALLVVSAITFAISAYTLVGDKDKFNLAMGYTAHNNEITLSTKGTGLALDNQAYSSDEGKVEGKVE